MSTELNQPSASPVSLELLQDVCPTKEFGAWHAQAAISCFDVCSHQSGLTMTVGGHIKVDVGLIWPAVEMSKVRAAFGDLQEATEYGAGGIAILVLATQAQLHCVGRSPKDGGGFDYYLRPAGQLGDLFQNTTRLEVSGILRGDNMTVRTRVKQKLQQLSKSAATGWPGYAVVVEFGSPTTEVAAA